MLNEVKHLGAHRVALALGEGRVIEHDNLEEFQDPYLYDLEETYYAPDGPFIESLARETGGPLLDVACGAGRLAIPFAQQGFAVTGVDLALPMIERARRKADEAGVSVRFEHGDARTMELGERFGLAYLTGNAFQAFLTRADQDALLRGIREHLRDDRRRAFPRRAAASRERYRIRLREVRC